MAKKSATKVVRASAPKNPFRSAIQAGDVAAVRKLIANGMKPDGEVTEEAAELCNKAYEVCHQKEKPLFGRMPTRKQLHKAEAEALAGYEMTKAILEAGAPVPNELCPAARSGNTRLALLLIKHGADVNFDPPMGTPLENAVKSGDVEIVRALVSAGADVHRQGYLGSVLTRAVSEGQLQVAQELIRAGAEVSAKPRFGQSALMKAVEAGREDFVRLLLESGADVNLKDDATVGEFGEPEVKEEGMVRITHVPNPECLQNATPLIVAARKGFVGVAAQLITAKAELEAVDANGLSAMAYAVKTANQAMRKLLGDTGAKALEYAEGSRPAAWIAAAKAGDCARLEALLKEGVDANLKHSTTDEPEEGTALTHAAENGRVAAVELLLKSGARVDERCGLGGEDVKRTALMHAARGGQVEVASVLIEAGASVAAKDRRGWSALHYAAENGRAGVIRALVEAGGRVDVTDKDGSTPLMEAAGKGHAEAVRTLLELKADANAATKEGVTSMFDAAMDGHTAVVKLLLANGARVRPVNPMFSPLEAASGGGHSEVVSLLLKAVRGSEGGERKASKPDGSSLISAIMSGKTEIVRSLLEAGADANAVMDDSQFTALMTAVRMGHLKVLRMLLAAGADVNAMNEDRETALDLAYEGIRTAKGQLGFLRRMGEDDQELKNALDQLKQGGGEDELTAALREAGGKRGKELKGVRRPKVKASELEPEAAEVEDLPVPDFKKRAKSPEFQKAIRELASLCTTQPKPAASENGGLLQGCASFRVSTEAADKILAAHHEPFLKRGFYLLKSERGIASGKDTLALLPTDKRAEVFASFQTNGANSGAYPTKIVAWFDALAKEQPLVLTGAGFDWCEGRFTQPIKDSKQLAKKMYDFCPDIVTQGVGDIARLALELKKTQKFFFWWD